jgi:hypothetical protein
MKKYNIQEVDSFLNFLISSSPLLSISWESYLKKMHKDSKRLYYFDMMEISRMIVTLLHLKKSEELNFFLRK